jgi:hypothetical protein
VIKRRGSKLTALRGKERVIRGFLSKEVTLFVELGTFIDGCFAIPTRPNSTFNEYIQSLYGATLVQFL